MEFSYFIIWSLSCSTRWPRLPSRTRFHRSLTLSLTTLYGALLTWLAWEYPGGPAWAAWASLAYVAYYVILSLWPKPSPTGAE